MKDDVDERFSELLGDLDYPVYVVTATSGGVRAGCLIGFTTQASIEPPRFLACLSKKNRTYDVAVDATHIAVHFLGPESRDLAHLFGEETGDEVDKFTLCEWTTGPHDTVILDGVRAWFVGHLLDRVDLGDHVGHLLEPVAVEISRSIKGMLSFADVQDFDAGHPA